jgi:hypothetical protein
MRDRSSQVLAHAAALVAGALALAPPLAGCSSQAAPTDEAIARYVGGTSETGATGPDGPAVAAARATRISITVERATGLQDHDGPGVTDAYVMLEVEGNRARTSVVEGSLTPVWGDSFAFDVRAESVLQLRLMDEDSLASDELIGTVVVPLPLLHVGESVEREALFKNGDEGRVTLTLTGLGAPR